MTAIPVLRGLTALTWLEMKIFMREPMGLGFTVVVPVILFVGLGRMFGAQLDTPTATGLFLERMPVLVAVFIAINAAQSLVAVIAIYRESGILKRLRATPLSPVTILVTQVLIKLILTAVSVALMLLAGRRYYPTGADIPALSFTFALLLSTWSILSLGFIIASLVRTARFAAPVAGMVTYGMLPFCGLFQAIEELPMGVQILAYGTPLTPAVSLLSGIWEGNPWSAHLGDVLALTTIFGVCTLVTTRVFRWE